MEWRKKEGWEEDVSSKGPLWRFPSLISFLLGVVWFGGGEPLFRGFSDAISVSKGCESWRYLRNVRFAVVVTCPVALLLVMWPRIQMLGESC